VTKLGEGVCGEYRQIAEHRAWSHLKDRNKRSYLRLDAWFEARAKEERICFRSACDKVIQKTVRRTPVESTSARGPQAISNAKTTKPYSSGHNPAMLGSLGSLSTRRTVQCVEQRRIDMTKSRLIPAALASLLAVGALGAIFTQTANAQAAKIEQTDPSEFPMIDGAKVSLAEAIATAEKEFGGKAAAAGIDDEKGSLAYEIELLTATGEQKVSVDAATGRAVAMAEKPDAEDEDGDSGENEEANDSRETGEGAEGRN
jgi:uncharacterized membrane protein YkoI